MRPLDGELSTREARDGFFAEYGFGEDGGYSKSWVYYDLGPLRVPVPNSRARARAVPIHDLHHLATGYCSRLREEFEIAAWELGGGCGGYVAAWVLNFLAFSGGIVVIPRRLFRAFLRGRRSHNLYHSEYDEALLDLSLNELRERIGLVDGEQTATTGDLGAFVFWCGLSFVWLAALLAGLIVILRWLVF